MDATPVTYAGPPPGFAVCPRKQVILFGFALHTAPRYPDVTQEKFHMRICRPGSEKCDGVGTKLDEFDDVRIWALCGEETLPMMTQVIAESRGTTTIAKCPENMGIALGFGISTTGGNEGAAVADIYPCRTGQRQCSKQQIYRLNKNTDKNYVWMVCFDKAVVGREDLTSTTAAQHRQRCQSGISKQLSFSCPNNTRMLSGFGLQLHTEFSRVDVRDAFKSCKLDSKACKTNGSSYCKNKTVFYDGNYQGFLGFAICTSEKEQEGTNASKPSSRDTLLAASRSLASKRKMA
ncbi:MAC/Perforin domain-containing protein [Cardiosporidium cionae]|uniref:MAC/Perforin domain-containing protein n=1 Tax=Cardiosporidium cionae TaxID=476202 RepID=A0ABQ7JF57_9APIC|nr:MAC/Perforin domain-containing protein [Cardiosporidium cionae]|eukprot:KAF8822280.1 MAC/Perforin domain-containing protein [Cardiosporidium cionae]